MKVNCDHETTLKASIIPLIQLIGGITVVLYAYQSQCCPGFTATKLPLLIKFADKRGGIANPGAIEGHFSDQLFNARLTGLISVSELKNAVAVTAAKSVMAFRVLTMAVDLCRLTTRTMNVNAGHERTSKARIIHQIQLIRGITISDNEDNEC
ncbi:hypothetical protein Asd1617_00606 [Shigella dysenteriae 1617]|uniref:Uncharacterized protein n=1 Tax=Shigella dysenteriae 1617 TaxID=754093 RepID=A0A0A6ZN05_SHIDY|nr:hypothetical protein Asd1617_00606 [Shigella dysenteriae 1617]